MPSVGPMVSMWEQSMMVGADGMVPGNRAMMFPVSLPVRGAEPSLHTSPSNPLSLSNRYWARRPSRPM